MLLPFLLTARQGHIDAAGEQTGILKSWMLSGRDDAQPVGYLWIEFERLGEFLTCGCGIKRQEDLRERITSVPHLRVQRRYIPSCKPPVWTCPLQLARPTAHDPTVWNRRQQPRPPPSRTPRSWPRVTIAGPNWSAWRPACRPPAASGTAPSSSGRSRSAAAHRIGWETADNGHFAIPASPCPGLS